MVLKPYRIGEKAHIEYKRDMSLSDKDRKLRECVAYHGNEYIRMGYTRDKAFKMAWEKCNGVYGKCIAYKWWVNLGERDEYKYYCNQIPQKFYNGYIFPDGSVLEIGRYAREEIRCDDWDRYGIVKYTSTSKDNYSLTPSTLTIITTKNITQEQARAIFEMANKSGYFEIKIGVVSSTCATIGEVKLQRKLRSPLDLVNIIIAIM